MQLTKIPFANVAITLYNQFKTVDPDTNKTQSEWLRTVIPNCLWGNSTARLDIGGITIKSDEFLVQIPEDTLYIDKSLWNGNKGLFTADIGDVIVRGNIDIDVPLNGSPALVLKEYAGRMLTIRSVSNNTGKGVPLGHIAVTGK